ncbi:hypothetical protein GN244_ATG06607 [Phytophthora infestans]|uniref:Uncharacterized protein n=1 Tax=Phytophthora infestans TaxID=4787 RepID=A0A833TEG5_PHYIN|nr:hypothetical protein GN244_ATG06607 [Phytophthora infestans]
MSSHRAPNATLGTGHPDFSERGIYLYETSPMMDEDLILENFRNHVVENVSFHHRGTKLLNELVIKKDYPPNQFVRILRHCITGLLPDKAFLRSIRHAGNRSRQSESFEYITFVVGSRPLHCIFPDKVASANRGRRTTRCLVWRQAAGRQASIREQMRVLRQRYRAEKERIRSSHRSANRNL